LPGFSKQLAVPVSALELQIISSAWRTMVWMERIIHGSAGIRNSQIGGIIYSPSIRLLGAQLHPAAKKKKLL
jgi:hypothetical protein